MRCIKLRDHVRVMDTVVVGIVTGVTEYIDAVSQCLVRQLDKDGRLEYSWYKESDLELM
jgi:hypothetical protein